jgi:hypothetical protein
MPTTVHIATLLMWIFWVFGALYFLTGWVAAMRAGYPSLAALTSIYVIVLMLLAGLILAVMKGHNWARITYAVFASIAIGSILLDWITATSKLEPTGGAIVLGYSVVLALLFHSTSRPWFSRTSRNAT